MNNELEQNRELLVAQMRDPKFYLESFCKIKGKDKGLIPFRFNEAQKDCANAFRSNNRIIILKARQMGFSTLMTGLFYHDTISNPATNTALIGYNSDMTAELLDKVKTFWKTTPKEIRPAIKYNSKFEISFPALDSKILVLPSTENVGRSYTLHNVLVTELSTWTKADEKMTALESSVPITGKIVVESTPRGTGNLYHRMWVGDNDYIKKEYGWWWGYSQEEIDTIRKRMNNPMKFAQEYGLEFLASGRSVFDPIIIKRQYVNILKVGDTFEESNTIKVEDDLKIYKDPIPGELYVFGVDVSEGVEGGDYSVAVCWNRKTGEEVAFYRGLVPADILGEKLDKWGRKFNNAFMVVEINNHGLTTLTALKKLVYPSIYFRLAKFETIGERYTDRMGWRTTRLTRPLLIDDFAQAMRDGLLTIHSKEILDEMNTFIYNDNGDMVSQGGYHDDCIFAAAIGFQGFKVLYDKPLDQINYEKELPHNFSY